MSNDLISRSAVFKLIESKCTDGCLGNKDITLIDAYDLLDDVSDLPTAYDVDNVIEQLEHLDLDGIRMKEDGKHYLIRQEEAIEIVKAGGMNESR